MHGKTHTSFREEDPSGRNDVRRIKARILEETGCVVDVKDFYTVVEDFFYAENRVEVWHSFRFLYRVLYKEGKMKIDGNNDDVTSASFVDVKTLTEKIQNYLC